MGGVAALWDLRTWWARRLFSTLRLLLLTALGALTSCAQPDAPTARMEGCPLSLVQPVRVNIVSYPSPGMPLFADRMASCDVPRLTVHHLVLPFDQLVMQANIGMASQGQSSFQIIHVYDQLLVEWASKGCLLPLDSEVAKYWKTYHLDEISPELWQAVSYRGHIYALPAIQNTETFIYRRDLFARYDLHPPETYADLLHVAQVLQRHGDTQYPLALMASRGQFSYLFGDILASLGGHWFDNAGHARFNDATGVRALEMIRALRPYMHPAVTSTSPEDITVGLQQGQFAMAQLWSNASAQMDDPHLSRFVGHFGFAPPPRACVGCPRAAYWAQDSWALPVNGGVDPDLLVRLILASTDLAGQRQDARLALMTRRPALANMARDRYWAPAMRTIAEGASALPRTAWAHLASEPVERFGIAAVLGDLPAKSALDQAAAEFERRAHHAACFETTPPNKNVC